MLKNKSFIFEAVSMSMISNQWVSLFQQLVTSFVLLVNSFSTRAMLFPCFFDYFNNYLGPSTIPSDGTTQKIPFNGWKWWYPFKID